MPVSAPHLRVVRPGERLPRRHRPRLVRRPPERHPHTGELARPDAGSAARSDPARRDRSVPLLVASAALLTGIGLVMVLSASSVSAFSRYGSSFTFFRRQLVYAVIGFGALLLTSRMQLKAWQRLAFPMTVVSTVLLVAVLHPAAGVAAGGASRWIAIGPVTIQPSELVKFAIVTLTATILARKYRLLDDAIQVALPLLPITGVLCFLVMLQPDLGTTMVISVTVFLMLFIAGVRLGPLLVTGGMASALGAAMILSAGYRRSRFLAFLHPWADPTNTGYQIIQSLIALTSGWFGVGLGNSRQKWEVLPNAHTDFIFSIIREELGLAGALLLLVLFGILVYAGVRIAVRASDVFGRLLAAGIVSWFAFQTLVNLGAVTGLLPITGVPLPFVSFGGSALVVSLAAVGVLVAVHRASNAAGRSREPRSR